MKTDQTLPPEEKDADKLEASGGRVPRLVLAWWQAAMREVMALFPEVEWDRYAGGPLGASTFGWIQRPEGQRDFLVIRFEHGVVTSFTTSSAKHSASIARRLDFTHSDCRKASEILGQNS